MADSVHKQCLDAAVTEISGLSLSGITTNVKLRKIPAKQPDDTLPICYVSPLGTEQTFPTGGTNTRDDLGYPVLVSLVDADNRDESLDDTYTKWRELIMRHFRNQRLTGVSEIWNCFIEPFPVVMPEAYFRQFYHSAMLLRFISRETRG